MLKCGEIRLQGKLTHPDKPTFVVNEGAESEMIFILKKYNKKLLKKTDFETNLEMLISVNERCIFSCKAELEKITSRLSPFIAPLSFFDLKSTLIEQKCKL